MGSTIEAPLRVVIVGAGFCGLTAAIECQLRGMHPILVEIYNGPSSHGDLLDFVSNAGRVFNSWDDGKVRKALFAGGVNAARFLELFNQRDELLRRDDWPQDYDLGAEGVFARHRGSMHRVIYKYAQKIGVEIQAGNKVVQYLDSDTELGVLLADGRKVFGDVVLACDGPKSLART